MTGVVTDLAGLPALAGSELGATAWREMTQERVNAFADATDDHQFIHVDPRPRRADAVRRNDRARLPDAVAARARRRSSCSRSATRRWPSTTASTASASRRRCAVGAEFRAAAEVTEVRRSRGGVQVHVTVTVEVRDQPKPAAVAELLLRFYA